MAACAPQDPAAAAREIERAVGRLGFKAVMVNGHTHGEYLDAPKFLPILETAAALGVPIYIHPTTMPRAMIQHFLESGLDGAVYGFGVDTGLHVLRLIVSGVFDRLPTLKLIIGHMGEALPFWQYRLDYMHLAGVRSHRYAFLKPLNKPVSDYLRDNVYITNSGVAWAPAIRFTQETVGVDNTLYAMDYPYQCDVEEVIALDGMDMDPALKKKFFQTNAETAFNL
jgi:2,3-dihydroxybenzoate decarboxylase